MTGYAIAATLYLLGIVYAVAVLRSCVEQYGKQMMVVRVFVVFFWPIMAFWVLHQTVLERRR